MSRAHFRWPSFFVAREEETFSVTSKVPTLQGKLLKTFFTFHLRDIGFRETPPSGFRDERVFSLAYINEPNSGGALGATSIYSQTNLRMLKRYRASFVREQIYRLLLLSEVLLHIFTGLVCRDYSRENVESDALSIITGVIFLRELG